MQHSQESSSKGRLYHDEIKDLSWRLMFEWRQPHQRSHGGFFEIGQQVNLQAEMLRDWHKQWLVDQGHRLGVNTAVSSRSSADLRVIHVVCGESSSCEHSILELFEVALALEGSVR